MLTAAQTEPGRRVSLYFTNELDDRIDNIAAEQKRSKSQTVRLLIEQALNFSALVKV
jgi:predicted DNA-binding protein